MYFLSWFFYQRFKNWLRYRNIKKKGKCAWSQPKESVKVSAQSDFDKKCSVRNDQFSLQMTFYRLNQGDIASLNLSDVTVLLVLYLSFIYTFLYWYFVQCFFFLQSKASTARHVKKLKCQARNISLGLGRSVITQTVCRKYDNNKIVAFVIMLWQVPSFLLLYRTWLDLI